MITLSLGPSETVLEYWARALNLCAKCYQADVPMSTKYWMALVLKGLPDDWEDVFKFQRQQ